jgi:hypothetical protein
MSGRLPTFLVIGAMKAGTTSLHEYLSEHPQIFMSRTKEPDFFAEELNWGRGLSWYEQQFAHAENPVIAVGESSTAYSKHPELSGVPARIAKLLPDVRLIYLVRHPIERIRSHYQHHFIEEWEDAPIERALHKKPFYVDVSRYALQIEQYLEYFDRDRLLILDSRRLRDDRDPTLRRIYGFLGVDDGFVAPSLQKEYNRTGEREEYRPAVRTIRRAKRVRRFLSLAPGPVKRVGRQLLTHRADPGGTAIPEDLRQRLEDLLREDVRRLRTYMGDDFDGWGIG